MWRESPKNFLKDGVATFGVTSETLDRDCWNEYKEELEKDFGQEEIAIRKLQIEIL